MDKKGSNWIRASAWVLTGSVVAVITVVGHSWFWYPLLFLAFGLYDYAGGRSRGLVGLGALAALGVAADAVVPHPVHPLVEPYDWVSGLVSLGAFALVFTALRSSRRHAAEQAAQLRALVDNLPVGVSVMGEGGRLVLYNQELQRILKLNEDDLSRAAYRQRRYLRADGSVMGLGEFATTRVLGGEPRVGPVTTGVVAEDGARIWVDVTSVACRLGEWRVLTVTGDITALKTAEDRVRRLLEEKDILLHEVHHRVKNNFLTVRSLLLLRAETSEPSVREVLLVAAAQVQGMAEVYAELFQRPADGLRSSALGDLALRVIALFGRDATVALRLDIEEVVLPPDQASPLAILVNELVTNSLKHAWAPGARGTIGLGLLRQGRRWRFHYSDDGTGFIGAHEGFGLKLLEMLAQTLGGELEREVGEGVQWTLVFPVAREGLVDMGSPG